MVKKYKKDGKVAIIVSPGYGAGWSTWVFDKKLREELIFDYDIVEILLSDIPREQQVEKIECICKIKYPKEFCDTEKIEVEWLDEGADFYIKEYDGNESVVIGHNEFFRA